jgi:hypothetical protein
MKLVKANGESGIHIYCSVDCKKCKESGVITHIILKYMGLADGREEYDLPPRCKIVFDMPCEVCKQTGRYTRAEVEVIGLFQAPPEDFVEQF